MSNTVINPTVIAKEALMQLENNLVMGNNVYREYKKEFVKVGDTVNVRMPVDFTVTDGATRTNQDVIEKNTTVVVDQRKHVSWNFSTQELTLSIEEYSERYIKPACIRLANTVDAALCGLYKYAYHAAGSAGSVPSAFSTLGAVAQKMDEVAVPTDNRKLVLNPAAGWSMADALKGVYSPKTVEDMIRKGSLGEIAGLDIYRDQNIARHVKGTATGTPLVNGASQNVTYTSRTSGSSVWTQTLITDGWTNSVTGIVKQGDIFTIAGVYAVNPISKASTNALQQFTVMADANSGASTGPATITISPPIISSGIFQTVDAAPADDAAITVVATHAANLAFHKNAIALVTVPLELPDSAGFKARESENGLSIRVVKDYDIDNDTEIIRLDVLYGVKMVDPRMAVRLLG